MKNKSDQLSFTGLALALANDYQQLFVIDPENDSYAEYSAGGDEKNLVRVSDGDDFFKDVRKNCREQVLAEDQEHFLNAFRKDAVIKALENGKSFSLTYRLNIDGRPKYFFLKTIRSADRSIIIGVQEVDEQKRRELEAEAEGRTYGEIAKSLATQYEVIYHVDVKTGKYTEYSSSDRYAELGFHRSGKDFFERVKIDIKKVIHPDDCQRVINELEKENLLNRIRSEGSASITYRHSLDGESHYMNLIAYLRQDADEHLVIGVRNIDEQKKQETAIATYAQIAGALASRYEVIYHINVETDEYTQYSSSEQYSKLGTTKQEKDFFADSASDIKKYIYPDDVGRLLERLDKDNLIGELKRTGSVSLSYRQLLDGKFQYMNMLIVRPKNDDSHIVMGVLNNDSQVRHEKSIASENRTFSDISMALAQRYEVIYHVNIITNEYSEYTASEKYAKLKVGIKGKDFFAETQKNMQRDIYPEDLPMMSVAMQKDNLMKSLSVYGKTFLNYRLMLDGDPQYVSLYAVRPKEASDYIIVAVANVDAAKRMELAYQSAVDMANRDALTNVKNKRAYAQAETELDELIEKKEQPLFAIVVCDINGLKQINDTRGHKAGDEYIKSSCSLICNVFNHSPVYRIGGDEFTVLLKGRDYENRHELIKTLGSELDRKRVGGIKPVAVGLSEFEQVTDMRVQDVFERADSLMYADKLRCKSEPAQTTC